MMSKAPPVPQLTPSLAPEDHSTNKEVEERQVGPPQSTEIEAAGEGIINATVDEITEEQQEAPSANTSPEALRQPREQLLQKPELRVVQKQADDRLFTWAAVGLTIAIAILLLKKFMKASGHGAVFMDGS